MNEKYYYCYSTNNKLLGEMSRNYLKKIKHDSQHHDFTTIISKFLVISSLLIDNGSKSTSLKIENPNFKNNELAKVLYFNLSLKPVKELSHDLIDETQEYRKVTSKIKHDNFSEFSDELYGDILKYTAYINLEGLNITDTKNFNNEISNFVVQLFYYIKQGNIPRDLKIQLPIGKEVFNIKIDCTVKY